MYCTFTSINKCFVLCNYKKKPNKQRQKKDQQINCSVCTAETTNFFLTKCLLIWYTSMLKFLFSIQNLLQSYISILNKKLKRTNNWTEQLNDEQLNAPLLYLVEKVRWLLCRANAYLEDVSYLQILSDNPAACWYIS